MHLTDLAHNCVAEPQRPALFWIITQRVVVISYRCVTRFKLRIAINVYIKSYQSFIYSPTDALVSCLKNNIKIYIKTAPTCFGAVTPSSGSALFVLTKIRVVKIVH